HARRGDYLWQLLAIAMTAAHWFNPLAWWVASRLRMEAEAACDDAVLACGCKPSDYAACLYQMVRAAKAAPVLPFATLSMARASELPRRLAMILSDKTNRQGLHSGAIALTLIASVALGSFFGPTQIGRAQTDNEASAIAEKAEVKGREFLDHVNASPTEKAGVYHVSPVFKRLVMVTLIKRGGPYGPGGTKTLEGWDYNRKSGQITVKETVDNEREMLVVHGKRKVPWVWQIQGAIRDVKVLIGEKAAVRGEDYEVDEVAGKVQFLKDENSKKGVHYYINYTYANESGKSGSIGNHPDRALVRKFLGLPPEPDNKEETGKTSAMNASRTDNPMIWTIMRPVRPDSIKVGLGRRSEKEKLTWLVRGNDFVYDETLATIILVRYVPLEDDSWMFVSGVPAERGRFLFHSELTKGDVKVILGERRLEEGVDYEVDYEQGIVTVLDKTIEEQGAKYFIFADGRAVGNQKFTEAIRKLRSN
ncbi:MAG: M56 family metallopeptidase, partial [Pirellulaceae bacterium]